MLRRATSFTIVAVLAMAAASGPALAARPPVRPIGAITGIDMVQSIPTWIDCGVRVSATFNNIGDGRYWVRFGIHDQIYGSTITKSVGLSLGQTSAFFELGSGSPGGDTFDRGQATLYHGSKVVDSAGITKTISCP